jgi:HEAT repeat protein
MLRDKSPAVRLAVAQNLDERLRGLAMTVTVALADENRADLVREYLLALGRMKSSEAVKVLSKAAEPGGKLFGRKPLSTRIAAIEALGLVGSSPARAALEGLRKDADASVREAVEKELSAER